MANRTVFNDPQKLDEFLDQQIQALSAQEGLDYGQALLEVKRRNPAIWRLRDQLYQAGQDRNMNRETYEIVQGLIKQVDLSIEAFIQEAMREHPELTQEQALRAVLSEHRDIVCLREKMWQFVH